MCGYCVTIRPVCLLQQQVDSWETSDSWSVMMLQSMPASMLSTISCQPLSILETVSYVSSVTSIVPSSSTTL